MTEEEKTKNEIKLTRQNIDISVSTTESLDRAIQTIHELMEKYGETKKKNNIS